jgi:MFS family permease
MMNGRSWTVIILFGIANAVAFMDRGFINLVAEPIRLSLSLSDIQMGLLIGPAFILFYGLVALPIGRLADAAPRKGILLAGVVVWSLCVSMTGLSRRYWQLAASRMGLGIGEATLNPAAISIISDLVPRERLSAAVAVFVAIGALGAGLGSLLGGLLLGWLHAHGATDSLAPWRVAFLIMGLPGLLLAALVGIIVREPQRTGRMAEAMSFPWREALAYLTARRAGTLYVIAGFALISALPTLAAWIPAFLSRGFGWAPSRIGPALGLAQLLTNPTGIIIGGLLADRLRRHGREDGNLRVVILSLVAALPFYVLFPLMPTPGSALFVYGPANFFTMVCFGASTPAIPLLVPAAMRSQGVAVMFLAGNVMGALGPLLPPLLTQYVFHDPKALRQALMIVPAVICPLSALILLRARPAFLAQVSSFNGGAQP